MVYISIIYIWALLHIYIAYMCILSFCWIGIAQCIVAVIFCLCVICHMYIHL